MRPIVVFDTNILFSATGWQGSPLLSIGNYQGIKIVRAKEFLDVMGNSDI